MESLYNTHIKENKVKETTKRRLPFGGFFASNKGGKSMESTKLNIFAEQMNMEDMGLIPTPKYGIGSVVYLPDNGVTRAIVESIHSEGNKFHYIIKIDDNRDIRLDCEEDELFSAKNMIKAEISWQKERLHHVIVESWQIQSQKAKQYCLLYKKPHTQGVKTGRIHSLCIAAVNNHFLYIEGTGIPAVMKWCSNPVEEMEKLEQKLQKEDCELMAEESKPKFKTLYMDEYGNFREWFSVCNRRVIA